MNLNRRLDEIVHSFPVLSAHEKMVLRRMIREVIAEYTADMHARIDKAYQQMVDGNVSDAAFTLKPEDQP